MRIGITGTSGLFGYGIEQVFRTQHETVPLPHRILDITQREPAMQKLGSLGLDILVHPAGIADVDFCELNPELARRVNVQGTANLVEAARAFHFGLMFVSTDALFDGKKGEPYTEEDPVNPPSVYGRTKVEAEGIVTALPQHWIVRVSVLFGPGKTNFIEKGLKKLQAGEIYRVASDQVGCATYTLDAAHAMMQLIERDSTGTFHVTNYGACNREELAVRAAEIAGLDRSLVRGLPSQMMKRPGPRVPYAVLSTQKIERLGMKLRPWQEALEQYIRTYCLVPHSAI